MYGMKWKEWKKCASDPSTFPFLLLSRIYKTYGMYSQSQCIEIYKSSTTGNNNNNGISADEKKNKSNIIKFHQSNRWWCCCVSYLFSGWLIWFSSQCCAANLSIILENVGDWRSGRIREFQTNIIANDFTVVIFTTTLYVAQCWRFHTK